MKNIYLRSLARLEFSIHRISQFGGMFLAQENIGFFDFLGFGIPACARYFYGSACAANSAVSYALADVSGHDYISQSAGLGTASNAGSGVTSGSGSGGGGFRNSVMRSLGDTVPRIAGSTRRVLAGMGLSERGVSAGDSHGAIDSNFRLLSLYSKGIKGDS